MNHISNAKVHLKIRSGNVNIYDWPSKSIGHFWESHDRRANPLTNVNDQQNALLEERDNTPKQSETTRALCARHARIEKVL